MYVMGLDIGYSNLKIVHGYSNQKELSIEVLPVGVMPADGSKKIISSKNGEEVLVNGTMYRAGIDPGCLVKWKRSLHTDYPSTDEYLALFMLALKKSNKVLDLTALFTLFCHRNNRVTFHMASYCQCPYGA
jgi:plasmid segregation protein ParM